MFPSLIFLHIPKCGGSSFRELLYQKAKQVTADGQILVAGQNIANSCDFNWSRKNPSKKKFKTLLSAGHFKPENIKDFFSPEDNTISTCILRNPVERYISHIEYFHPEEIRHGWQKSLEDPSNIIHRYGNIMSKWLLGDVKVKSLDDPKTLIGQIKQLNISFFYILEEMKQSMTLFNSLVPDWQLDFEKLKYLNARPKSPLSLKIRRCQETMIYLKKINEKDYWLYRWAKEKLAEEKQPDKKQTDKKQSCQTKIQLASSTL